MSITNENILEEIIRSKQELKALVEAIEVRLTLKIEDLNRRTNRLEIQNEHIINKIENLERKSKENNIIIFGLNTEPGEITVDYIRKEIKKLVDVNIAESDLNNFYPLGKTNNPPIKIELTSFLKKATILKNARKLRGTRISIASDLTIKQRHENNILRKHLNLAKGNKENNCYIRGNRLHVDGKIYTAEELENQEETGNNITEKPQSAPGTPIATTIRELPKQTTKSQQTVKNIQQKTNTPTERTLKEVGGKLKMKTRSEIGK